MVAFSRNSYGDAFVMAVNLWCTAFVVAINLWMCGVLLLWLLSTCGDAFVAFLDVVVSLWLLQPVDLF